MARMSGNLSAITGLSQEKFALHSLVCEAKRANRRMGTAAPFAPRFAAQIKAYAEIQNIWRVDIAVLEYNVRRFDIPMTYFVFVAKLDSLGNRLRD